MKFQVDEIAILIKWLGSEPADGSVAFWPGTEVTIGAVGPFYDGQEVQFHGRTVTMGASDYIIWLEGPGGRWAAACYEADLRKRQPPLAVDADTRIAERPIGEPV